MAARYELDFEEWDAFVSQVLDGPRVQWRSEIDIEHWYALYTKPHIVRLDSDAAFPSVRSTSGLRRIVSFDEEPAAVPDHAILVSTS